MTNKELRRKKLADLIAEYGSQKAFGDVVGKDPAMFSQILNKTRNLGDKLARELEDKLGKPRGWFDGDLYSLIDCDQGCEYADILEEKLFEANAYLHKNEIPYQKFMELWNTDLTENQRDIIHKLFDQLKNVSADRNGFVVTIQNKNKEIAKLEAEMAMLKQMLLEAEESCTNQSHCFAVYRNIPHEGSFVTKLFAKEAAAKDWIEAGRAFQEANPMPGRPEWNPDIEDVESFVGSQKNLDYIAKTEELNTANAGRYLDEGETFSIKQLEINQ